MKTTQAHFLIMLIVRLYLFLYSTLYASLLPTKEEVYVFARVCLSVC